MMKPTVLVLFLSFLSCSVSGQETAKASNVFNLNGEDVTLSDELLEGLRNKWNGWEGVIATSSLINETDIRWIMDYISILELKYSPNCDTLSLIETRQFDPTEVQTTEVDIVAGLFDYAWEVEACGSKHIYRIVNVEGESDFTVYPSRL
jgi:hypothetical protein